MMVIFISFLQADRILEPQLIRGLFPPSNSFVSLGLLLGEVRDVNTCI